MKKDLHPKNYRFVVFRDSSVDFQFLCRSTVDTKQTTTWEDGKEYPLYPLDVSSASHPFYTGKMKLMDTEGRVSRFKKKYAAVKK